MSNNVDNAHQVKPGRYTGVLDCIEYGHVMEIKEFIIRQDEIAFSLMTTWNEQGKWLLSGVAKKIDDDKYAVKNIVSTAVHDSTLTDKGNDIEISFVNFNPEFNELDLNIILVYQQDRLVYEGMLELGERVNNIPDEQGETINEFELFKKKLGQEWRRYKGANARPHHRTRKYPIEKYSRNSFRIRMDIMEIPLHYRTYVKENKKFEEKLCGLLKIEKISKKAEELYAPFTDILHTLSEFETLIAKYEIEGYGDTKSFKSEKLDFTYVLESGLKYLESVLYSNFQEDFVDEHMEEQLNSVINSGFRLTEYWIDARF